MRVKDPKQHSISIIGTGNVGQHLYYALHKLGYQVQWYSRKAKQIKVWNTSVKVKELKQLSNQDSSLIFLAVPDDQIAKVSTKIANKGAAHIHVSGTCAMKDLASEQKGVCYFFQSMSKNQEPLDFSDVGAYLEASNPELRRQLQEIVGDLGAKVKLLDSDQRLKLHLSGVLVNNFGNQLLSMVNQLLDGSSCDLGDLQSLYFATYQKARAMGPSAAQTGPALRGDTSTLKKHKDILNEIDGDWAKLYQIFTKKIQEQK